MKPVAILVPTLRRPERLEAALRSVAALHRLDALVEQVVVVDNDPDGSAREGVERLRAELDLPLLYVHERTPGVATARNAGLRHVRAPHVAFLDDDEVAHPEWLERLHAGHERFGADVTFGAIQGTAVDARPSERPYLDRFFSRTRPEPTGPVPDAEGMGCGNSLMRRATALPGPAPFEPAADLAGGEDDRLFQGLARRGGRFAWVADAWVDEAPVASRATAAYVLSRGFARGQGPTRIRLRQDPPDLVGALGWMAVGAAQFVLFGAPALVLRLLGRPAWLGLAVRAAGGLGKTAPWKEMNFYGAALLSAPVRRGRPSAAAMATSITQLKSL